MNNSNSHHDICNKHSKNWLHLRGKLIDRLPDEMRTPVRGKIEETAKHEISEKRLDEIYPKVKHRRPSSSKIIAKWVIAIIGGITFSAGTQVLTARWGRWATPATVVLATAISYGVEDRATSFFTGIRKRHSTRLFLAGIEDQKQQQPPTNEFQELFYQTQTALVYQIERKNLDLKPVFLDGFTAAVLSSMEYVAAIWIIMQLGLPIPLVIELFISGIPVGFLCLASLIQSDYFELPEYYADLMEQYRPYLLPPEGLSEKELESYLVAKEQAELRLNAQLIFLEKGDAAGKKNLEMFTIGYDIEQLEARKKGLITAKNEEINQLEKRSLTEVEITGLTPQEIKRKRGEWIEIKTAQLELDYQIKINHCEEEIEAQKQKLEVAKTNFETSQQFNKVSS